MEFHEKLQELRKARGLTQEELAAELYVSRTAISKWESGRGYPSIDSLKEISKYFSVSIDELLSGDKLLSIVEKENRTNMRNMCDLLLGIVDVCGVLMIVLPLYPDRSEWISVINWVMCLVLILIGIVKLILLQLNSEKCQCVMTVCSMAHSIVLVMFLALTRASYAIVVAFLLLVVKGVVLWKRK